MERLTGVIDVDFTRPTAPNGLKDALSGPVDDLESSCAPKTRSFVSAIPLGFVILSEAPRESCTQLAGGRAVEGSRGYLRNHVASGSSLEGLSPEPHFASPVFGEVLPARIGFFDQCNFLLASPAFQLFLPANRI